ncbi:MAG: SGNH/GDSL hydrolase family protein [Sphingomonas sp.]
MKLHGALAALVLAAAAPQAAPLAVHVGGRAVAAADGSLRFGWPGVYFEGRFRGTAITVAVEAGTDHLRVLIDGQAKAVLIKPGLARLGLAGLGEGEHLVRLEKLTESQSGGSRLIGFYPAGGAMRAPPPRPHAIEFIGDSYTAGYGDTSPTRDCDRARVHDTTDTQQAFGPVLARRLDADYRVIAYSGYGVVRNYDGAVPGDSLPARYPRAIPGDPAPAADDGWRPQWIVVNLGTNDFSTPLHPGEAWTDQAALHTAYRARYVDFVRERIAGQPQARVILMGSDAFYADVQAVAAAVNAHAVVPVIAVRFGPLELTGCNYHPSLKDHQALADLLQRTVEQLR